MNEDSHPGNGAYSDAGAAIVRTGFGSHEIERRRETQATALAERAKAEIQARYIVAMQRPRTWETVWGSLIRECQRPSFAAAGVYRLKKGKKRDEETGALVDNIIEGLTIGFARSAMRAMGNVDIDETVVYEDEDKVLVRITATDIECNAKQSRDITVTRRIERAFADGRKLFGERKNSFGKTTYIVEPTDEEMDAKIAARASKMRRTLILDLLPADLKSDCFNTIMATREKADLTDPDTNKKKLIASFAGIGVNADALIVYLGHALEQITAGELEELRGVFAAIQESETNWTEALTMKRMERGEVPKVEADKGGDALKAKLAKNAAKDTAKAESPKP